MVGLFNKKGKPSTSDISNQMGNGAILPDDKKSISDIKTHNTNILLLVIAIIMLGIFIAGALFSKNKDQVEINALDNATNNTTTSKEEKKEITENFTYIAPVLKSDPETLNISNVMVGEESFNSIMLSVQNTPIKILSANFSTNIDGLQMDQDCTARPSITPESNCIINVIWTPTKKETKNIFILLTYNDPEGETALNDKNEKGKIRNFKINLSLSSNEPEKQEIQPQQTPTSDEFFEDETYYEDPYYDDETYYEDEESNTYDENLEPLDDQTLGDFATPQRKPQTTNPNDCKKYASKAYDFSGTFIGWVQSNNDVFAPNCSKVIGVLQDDGMVLETATGKLLGKGVIMDNKKSEEKRIELTLPLLEEVSQITSQDFNPNFEDVWANREAVKLDGYGGKTAEEGRDLYKADDPLGIYAKQQEALIPMSIKDTSQVSSMPKDEKYILRQAKPIPAVLARPIYFGNISYNAYDEEENVGTTFSESSATAVAIVERNVYGGTGRSIIIPSGSQLIGTASAPNGTGLQEIQKISINWTRLIRPDGAEFDLGGIANYTGDAQGRQGVAGKNDTEYMRDLFVKPLLYSVLPVAMEALFPTSSQFVTRAKRSDGTYQVIDTFLNEEGFEDADVTTGEEATYGWTPTDTQTIANLSSKDKMKMEIEQNWKTVMQKLIEQSAKNKIPFTVPAGTRIMIFLDQDIMLRIDEEMQDILENSNTDSQYQHTHTSEQMQFGGGGV